MASAMPGAKFIDPVVLSRIGNLELIAKTVVDGLINGTHRSPFYGASVDFAEHRGYVRRRRHPPRRLARLRAHRQVLHQGIRGRLERQLLGAARRVEVDGLRREDLEARLRQDAGGVPGVSRQRAARSRRPDHVRQRSRRAHAAVGEAPRRGAAYARRAKPARPGNLVGPLRKLAEHFGRRGIIVVISDFYAEPEEIFHAVGPIVHRGNDVVLFHVMDPQEIDFSFAEAIELRRHGERRSDADRADQARRRLPRAGAGAHRHADQARPAQQPVDYMLLNTSMPLDYALFRFLSMRQRLARTR